VVGCIEHTGNQILLELLLAKSPIPTFETRSWMVKRPDPYRVWLSDNPHCGMFVDGTVLKPF
jgi:hypothetical protein